MLSTKEWKPLLIVLRTTALIILFLLPETVRGADPVLISLQPWGAQRGKPFTLTLIGRNLGNGAKLLSNLPASFTPLAPIREAGEAMQGREGLSYLAELKADAPVGMYPIRVQTEQGLSNVLLCSVGAFPEVRERESELTVHKSVNDSPETSEPISHPVTVNGTLRGPDRDVYKIQGKKAQRLVFEVEARRVASAIDPVIRLLDEDKKQIAISNDAPGLGLDCRLDVSFPADGSYYVVVHDARFSEQEANHYRLKIGSFAYAEGLFPMGGKRGERVKVQLLGGNVTVPAEMTVDLSTAAEKDDFALVRVPGNPGSLPFLFAVSDLPEMLEPEGAAVVPLVPSTVINGRISKPGEIDRFKLQVVPGEQWSVDLKAAGLGISQLFGRLTVFDSKGKRLVSAGDDIPNPDEFSLIEPGRTSSDPHLNFQVPDGTQEVFVTVEDLVERGGPLFGYRLVAKKELPDFTLSLSSPYVNVPVNGTAVVRVSAVRQGYKGPIQLIVPGAGEGLVVEGGYIPREIRDSSSTLYVSRQGVLTITPKKDARLRIEELSVWGEATLEDGTVIRRRARGPGLVTEILGKTGVPDPNQLDRYKPVSAPWLGFDLPLMVTKELPVRLLAEGSPSVRFVQGAEFPIKWRFESEQPDVRAPRKVSAEAPGSREVLITDFENSKVEYAKEGVFTMRAVERAPLQRFNLILSGEVETGSGPFKVYSRPVTVELVQGYRIEVPVTKIRLLPGGTAELAGKVVREPNFIEPVTIRADFLPNQVFADPVEVPGDRSDFHLLFQAQVDAKPEERDIQLAASSFTGSQGKKVAYKIPPVMIRMLLSATETSKLVNTVR